MQALFIAIVAACSFHAVNSFIIPFPCVGQLTAGDMNALKALYDGTGGATWKFKSANSQNGAVWSFAGIPANTASNVPCANKWQGVSCQNVTNNQYDCYVNALALPAYNLVGPLPAAWVSDTADANFNMIQSIQLQSNSLTGPIPVLVGAMTTLQTLNLQTNSLTGAIPAQLGNLTGLVTLNLGTNKLNGELPATLGGLTNLQNLDVSINSLGGQIPSAVGLMTSLITLSLNNNNFVGSIPPSLAALNTLQILSLNTNSIGGQIPSQLGVMTNLGQLYLYQNQLTGDLPNSLSGMSNLQRLYLYTNSLVGAIPNAYFTKLNNLQYFWAYQNQLSFQIPPAIGTVTNLYGFDVHSNSLTGAVPAITAAGTSLEYLILGSNSLSGTIPSAIGSISAMSHIDISFNKIVGSIPSQIGKYLAMTNIVMNNNQLTSTLPASLGTLTSLAQLSLQFNSLTGTVPCSYASLNGAVVVDLSNNLLSSTVPSSCAPTPAPTAQPTVTSPTSSVMISFVTVQVFANVSQSQWNGAGTSNSVLQQTVASVLNNMQAGNTVVASEISIMNVAVAATTGSPFRRALAATTSAVNVTYMVTCPASAVGYNDAAAAYAAMQNQLVKSTNTGQFTHTMQQKAAGVNAALTYATANTNPAFTTMNIFNPTPSPTASTNKLSIGAIVGIAIAAAVVFIGCMAGVWFYARATAGGDLKDPMLEQGRSSFEIKK